MDETTHSTAPPPPPGAPPPRLLRRRDGHLGGVAAGVGHYLDVDPNLARIGFVLLTLVGGSGVFLYLAGWLLIPTEAEDTSTRPVALRADSTTAVVGAVVLALAAWVFLGPHDADGGLLLPLVLVGLGVWLLNQRPGSAPQPAMASEPTTGQPGGGSRPAPEPTATWERTSTSVELAHPQAAVEAPGHYRWAPRQEGGGTTGGAAGAATPPPPPGGGAHGWAVPLGPDEPAPAAPTRPAGPPVTSITLAVLALVIGVLLVLQTVGAIDLSAVLLAATALVIIAGGLVAGAFLGRAKGLIPLALLAALGLAVAPAADLAADGGIADRVVRVADEGAIEDEYRLGIGNLVVDLRGLDAEELDRELEVAVGIGYAEVIVPEDVRVRVEGSVAAGYVQLFGRERDGTSVDLAVTDGPAGDDVLVLDADVRLGALEVRRG